MKKILISLLVMTLIAILFIGNYSYGADTDIELNLTGNKTIKVEDKTLILTLKLGSFTGISDNIILGYESVLDYDSTIFESVEVKGLNGWTVTYSNDTKRIIGDSTSAKANTDITQLIFTLKSGIETTTANVKLNNLTLATDNNTFDKSQTFSVNIQNSTISPVSPENPETPETPVSQPEQSPGTTSTPASTSSGTSTITSTAGKSTNDATTAGKAIPKAGTREIIALAIVGIIALVGIIKFVKYKDIELK